MKKALLALLLIVSMLVSMTLPGLAEEEKVVRLYSDRVYRDMTQWTSSDANVFEVMGNFSEGLFRLNPNHDPMLALAESYEISEDGTVYTFKLKEGLVWSDGRPLTAFDFAFGWIRAIDDPAVGYATVIASFIKNGNEYLYGDIDAEEVGVRAIDDLTFEVTLVAPCAFFDRLITLPVFFPLNQAFVEEKGDQYGMTAADVLYCGPFVCSEFDLAVGATLVKNPDYWDADAVHLDKVIFRVITDSSAALNAYEAGEVDRVNLAPADIPFYMDRPEFDSYSDFRNYYLQFDMTNPTTNVNIRKALGYAVDRQLLVEAILATGAVAAGGVVSQGVYGDEGNTFRELAGPLSRFDPELAKEYWNKGVEELGGTAPKLTLLTATGPDFDDVVVFLQDQYRTVLGADVTIEAMTQKARNDIMNAEMYDFALSAWGADYDDAMTWLELWTSGTGYRGHYDSEEYKALVNAAMHEADPAARLQIMIEAETLLLDTDVVVSGVYDRGFSYLLRPSVKGLVYHPVGQPLDLKWAYVE